MNDAEVAYDQLKSLLDYLKTFAEAKTSQLREAETALQGNSGNAEALRALAVNLRSLRQNILSELRDHLKSKCQAGTDVLLFSRWRSRCRRDVWVRLVLERVSSWDHYKRGENGSF